jgi:hypothetical protein
MCGRVIQSSGPLRYGIVEGMDVSDGRARNYPPRWNAAPGHNPHAIVLDLSWIQPGRLGGALAGDGRHGWMMPKPRNDMRAY